MKEENAKRIRLLKIWEILRQETDEEHPITTPALLNKLAGFGIQCDRRTLYSDINVLNDFGYEILKTRAISNEYYVVDRTFDIPEVQILMDAVQSAGFITEKKTEQLVDKIAQLAGSQRGQVLKQNIVTFSTPKSSNESIFYIVNDLSTAINNHKKISFHYFDYDTKHRRVYRKTDSGESKMYIVNPLATVFADDKYYMVCYDDKHGNVAQYRVDRMDNVVVLDEDITENKQVENLDIGKHKRQMFSMYGGDTATVSFIAANWLIDLIYDTFGENVKISEYDKKSVIFNAEVQISPTFFAWCCSFGDDLKLIAPKNVLEGLKEYIGKLNVLYADEK
jgi:predicted DNA-binding transcriptional regulator YafY